MVYDLERLFGRRNGLINELQQAEIPASEPKLYSFAAQRGCLPWEDPAHEDSRRAAGIGRSRLEALLRCCGELLERYCSSFVPADLPRCNQRAWERENAPFVPVSKLHWYAQEQSAQAHFPFRALDEEDTLSWSQATVCNPTEGEPTTAWIPAWAMYFPYDRDAESGVPFPSSTSGLSCGSSAVQAREGALLESIERDAYVNAWLNQLAPPQLEPSAESFADQRRLFRFDEIQYTLLDLTTDLGVPVVGALSFGPSSFGDYAALGLGCHWRLERAIEKALLENAMTRLAIHFVCKKDGLRSFRPDFLDVLSFQDHMLVYTSHPTHREKLRFFTASPERRPAERAPHPGMQTLLADLRDKGHPVYAQDLTTPDVASMGFHVQRVLVPSLSMLHGMHPYPFLGCQRLLRPWEVFDWAPKREVTTAQLGLAPPHMLG